jgi:hypothetical protein
MRAVHNIARANTIAPGKKIEPAMTPAQVLGD